MSELDALPHGILGLKGSLEEKSSIPLMGIMVALVIAVLFAAYVWFRRTKKRKRDRLQDLRQQLESLALDARFLETFSCVLKEGLFLKYGLDLSSKGAKDVVAVMADHVAQETHLAMPKGGDAGLRLPFKPKELELLFEKIEQELYAEVPLTDAEKHGFRDQAKEWLWGAPI